MKRTRSTFRRRQHVARNGQLPNVGSDVAQHYVIRRGIRVDAGRTRVNRGTGKGTERAIAREAARWRP